MWTTSFQQNSFSMGVSEFITSAAFTGDGVVYRTSLGTDLFVLEGDGGIRAPELTLSPTNYMLNFNPTTGAFTYSAKPEGMVFPSAGIPISTGTAWGTSITDNSSNWNTAYSWGDHSTEGYLTAIPGIDDVLGVGNYTTKKLALGSSVAPSSVFEARSASKIFIAKLIGQSSLTEGLHIRTAGTTGTSLLKMDNSSSTNIYNFLSSGLFTFKSLTGHPTSTPPGDGYGGLYMYDNTLWFYNGSNNTVYDLLDISGSGSTTFLGLTDTPSSYTAGKWLKVNSGGTALEFVNSPITSVTGSGSILTGGSSAVTVALENDLTTPGNSKYYGTNISGTKGWYSLPSGVGDMTKAVYDADENNIIDVIRGGTGQSGYTTGDILYASGAASLAKLNAGTSGYVLTSNGAGAAPSWQASGSSKWTDNGDIIYPTNKEDVRITNETPGLFFVDSNGDDISINVNNGTFYIYDDTNNNLLLATQTTDGNIVLGGYGSGSITGTAAYNLQVASDGTIIETAVADGGGTSENFSVVSLSGTYVSWNMSNGINAKITLSGNTTITLSNVPTGRSGNLTVTNPSSTYTITFSLSGKTVKVSPFLNSSGGAITMSGGSKIDVLSWYYDGTYFIVNGTLDYD